MAEEQKTERWPMGTAKIFLPIISRPEVEEDAAAPWIGKRPVLNAAATQ